jgi:hypothetical protein
MEISKNLNLTFSVKDEDGRIIKCHSTPMSKDEYSLVSLTFARLYGKIVGSGLSIPLVPSLFKVIALRELEREKANGGAEASEDMANFTAFCADLASRTFVNVATADGFEELILYLAVKRGLIDEEVHDEVLGQALFFTLLRRTAPMSIRQEFVNDAGETFGWKSTSLLATDWFASCPKLTSVETSVPVAEV